MTYESVAQFSQSWGLVFLVILFAAGLVYAFWPGNRSKFSRAARLPLEDDSAGPPRPEKNED